MVNIKKGLNFGLDDCPVIYPLKLISGKWKPLIIYMIRNGINRYGQLEKNINGITKQALAKQLKELEKDKLVKRTVFPEIPPRVEYSFTALGESLIPIIDALKEWSTKNQQTQD